MSERMDPLCTTLLQLGAQRENYEFNSVSGIRVVPTYVVRDVQQREGVDFQRANRGAAQRCSATLVLFVQPVRAFTTEEINASFSLGVTPFSPALVDIWLIFDRSFECQLSLLDAFGYSDESAQLERRKNDLKQFLSYFSDRIPFVFSKIGSGLAVLEIDKLPSEREFSVFFDALVKFKTANGGLDLSPGRLKRLIDDTQIVVL